MSDRSMQKFRLLFDAVVAIIAIGSVIYVAGAQGARLEQAEERLKQVELDVKALSSVPIQLQNMQKQLDRMEKKLP